MSEKFKPREIGIPFNGPMVRAIMGRSKTMTRRVLTPQIEVVCDKAYCNGKLFRYQYSKNASVGVTDLSSKHLLDNLPLRVGDRVYVRETWMPLRNGHGSLSRSGILYRADESFVEHTLPAGVWKYDKAGKWKPSIHMPKIFTRTWLRVTDVKVERVQEITEEDAMAEGCPRPPCYALDTPHRTRFQYLWNSIYAAPRPRTKNGVVTHYVCWPWSEEGFTDMYGANGYRSLTSWEGYQLYVCPNPWVYAATFEMER